ncbi:MAG: hypothetical protein Q7I97_03040 [Thermovirgaceae bacterium]|nr:hypothetical protein [Thermovirgaceae bacterium]
MQKTGRFFLVAILVLSVPLVALLLWQQGFRALAGPVTVTDAVVCRELDDSSAPVGAGPIFKWGGRQVCLIFRYEVPRPGGKMDVIWRFQSQVISRESIRINDTGGVRAFFLLREDGSPLPVGEYDVVIESDGRDISPIPFSVVR